MKRDSLTKSLWQSDIQPSMPTSDIPADEIFDVLIAGAGITGLTTGLFLQQAGKKCIIVEAENIGFGTSSATTAHLNTILDTHYYDIMKKFSLPEAELMAKGAAEAISIVRTNVAENSIDCKLTFCNGFLYAENKDQSEYLEKVRKSMKEVGILSTYTDHIPIPIPFDKALRVPGQAYFQPVKYLYGIAKAFEAAGGQLILQAPVEKDQVKDFDSYSIAAVGNMEIKARNIFYATHIPPGLNRLHFECTAYRSYVLAVQLEDGNYPEAVVYDSRDPYNYFRPASVNGTKYLVAGGFDHRTGHGDNEKRAFEELESYLRKYFKIKSVDFKWSSQYYEPADGLPYIGQLPGGNDHTFVATGFSGTGMTLGTLAGKIISDLVLTGQSKFRDLLSPSRIKPIAGFEKFIKKNADVVKHFIADRASIDPLKEFAEMSNDEGRVVEYEDNKIALYKDKNGKLTALSPVCTHAKCIVQWNNGEKSWDCPCHGSRFDPEGHILNGPAQKPLPKIELKEM